MIDILSDDSDDHGPRIWAIGGGKGGVGKSVLAANLAVVLARRRSTVVVVDSDLGGANLHTLFGIADPTRTLTDYIERRVPGLDDVVIETSVPGLRLLSGANALLEMANPSHSQKRRLLRHLRAIDADHVILDLGSGSSINVLDFYLASHRGILVVVPEPTSVENAYHFIKAAFFRKLKQTEPRSRVAAVLGRISSAGKPGPVSARDLVAEAMAIDPEVGSAVLAAAATFSASIVVNRAVSASHERLAAEMSMACREYYGISVDAMGTLPRDPMVERSVLDREPVAAVHPDSPFAIAVRRLAANLKGDGR
jgi:flagellar biosynthesis protein FlhG